MEPIITSQSINLQEILKPISAQLKEVEFQLQRISQESDGVLKDSSHYVLSGGGKRLRASLVLFCCAICSQKHSEEKLKNITEKAIQVAVAGELIHAATLVHDDIVDQSVIRRLKPTANIKFGNDLAILLGDFLYTRAFKMIANVHDTEITAWMAHATEQTCEGEIYQLQNRYRVRLTIDDYILTIKKKTASLIAVSAKTGAHLGELLEDEMNALNDFGMNIGISFQIIDDLLDIIGVEGKLGKTVHNDAGNGKMTLPMILLVQQMSQTEKEKFTSDFESLQTDWKWVQKMIDQYQIKDQTEQYAKNYFSSAIQSLSIFGDSVQQSLTQLSRFILKRDY